MSELTIETLRAELTPMREELKRIAAHVDGIPFIHRKVDTILQEQRMLRSAINDLARLQFTAGEIQALHDDVNAARTKSDELEVKIATLERLVAELQK